MNYLDCATRVALGTVFLVAAAGKARPVTFRAFVASLDAVRPLRRRLGRAAAGAVVAVEALIVEALIVVALIVPVAVVAGYLLAVAALSTFTVVAVAAMGRGERLRCRCFGADAGPIGRTQVVRNILLAAAGLGGLAAHVTAGAAPGVNTAGLVLAVAVGLAAGGIAVHLDDLVYLFTPSTNRRVT
ncbi:MAG TPA: MauE/DoxX family redox-associated membrane protein [Micromonosporaceae bacterium]